MPLPSPVCRNDLITVQRLTAKFCTVEFADAIIHSPQTAQFDSDPPEITDRNHRARVWKFRAIPFRTRYLGAASDGLPGRVFLRPLGQRGGSAPAPPPLDARSRPAGRRHADVPRAKPAGPHGSAAPL